MNSKDISKLSYKELQALALQYRVPGNIKKKLLVKVIQAAKVGNGNEVSRLLQDFKQNRKRKVRKVKIKKLGLTSTPLHNSDSVMTDDYYCSQQQPPCQWVGAEEEIANKDDDSRITQYEEFKQFLLKRMQRDNFHSYDANNNDTNNSTILYVRTPSVSSEQKDALETCSHPRCHVIAVNDTESFVYQSNENVEYQTLGDTNNNVQGPILLKKMLQAPVGANLGEIASPVFGNYKFWTMEHDQASNNILDDSDTLSAVSDNGDNEENLENNAEYYGFLNSVKGEYFLNEPTFAKNTALEKIGQFSNVLTNENANQCKYYATNNDINQEYETWTVANVMATTDNNGATSDFQPKMFQNVYCDNVGPDTLHNPVSDDHLSCQYKVAEVTDSYNANQNILTLHPSEENQYYERNLIPNVLPDCQSTYYVPDTETNVEYVPETQSNVNANQNPVVPQTFANYNQYNSDLSYEYSYSQSNLKNIPLSGNPEQFDQNCNAVQIEHNNQRNMPNVSEKAQVNGVLDPFWPNKHPRSPYLENMLNLISNKRIDLSKVDQTSCVYCYVAPIVTHTSVSSNSTCSQKEKFVAEYRQHSFSPNWLLYNDTSYGLRMANLQAKIQEESRIIDAQMSTNNSDLRESAEGSTSMSEVWTHNYEDKDVNMGEDLNTTVTDCLFSVINTDPLVSHATNFSKNQAE
ncbi:rho GTPase-activating protein gacZ-like [Ceratina calcarata]|uniref:Rho GTPase-activating protein gacZ-like n=1 Tax=Ceratina calcarata TaxID=156304 RepID=A0AAJ7ND43_9HYME|nr:rho GTPase-activating protein gacZ-like [Ceratina calcarata]